MIREKTYVNTHKKLDIKFPTNIRYKERGQASRHFDNTLKMVLKKIEIKKKKRCGTSAPIDTHSHIHTLF